MADKEFALTVVNPQDESDVVFDASPTALDGSNVLQLTYDDAVFTTRQSLLLALDRVRESILDGATSWPPA